MEEKEFVGVGTGHSKKAAKTRRVLYSIFGLCLQLTLRRYHSAAVNALVYAEVRLALPFPELKPSDPSTPQELDSKGFKQVDAYNKRR